jgi:hypothetical protein
MLVHIQTTCNFLKPSQTKKATINQSHDDGVGGSRGVDKIQNYNIFSVLMCVLPGCVCPGLKGKAGAHVECLLHLTAGLTRTRVHVHAHTILQKKVNTTNSVAYILALL